MMWKVAEPRYEAGPGPGRALDVLFILHADHEQNCGTLAMRTVGSSHADPYSAAAAAAAALYGPRHGGANEAVLRMLTEIGSIDNVKAFIDDVKAGKGKLQGFGHRVYKNYDPRATIIKKTADDVFSVTGKNPLLDIALKLEEVALSDDYFISRKLYPNVDFYSGLIYQAMNFPTEHVHRPVRHPQGVGLAGPLAGDDRAGLPRSTGPASCGPATTSARTSRWPSPRASRSAGPAAAAGGDPQQPLLHHRHGQARHHGCRWSRWPAPGPRPRSGCAGRRAATRRPGRAGETTWRGRGWPGCPRFQISPWGSHDGVEQGHVAGVGHQAGVEERVVGELAVGAHPHQVSGLAGG